MLAIPEEDETPVSVRVTLVAAAVVWAWGAVFGLARVYLELAP